jgi:hypothetical protein
LLAAFNDFLADKFGGAGGDDTGEKTADDFQTAEETPAEDAGKPSDSKLADNGSDFGFDETDIDIDGGAEGNLDAKTDEELKSLEPHTGKEEEGEVEKEVIVETKKESNEPKDKKEEKDSQYISGVREVEDEDDSEPDLTEAEDVYLKLDEEEKLDENTQIEDKQASDATQEVVEETVKGGENRVEMKETEKNVESPGPKVPEGSLPTGEQTMRGSEAKAAEVIADDGKADIGTKIPETVGNTVPHELDKEELKFKAEEKIKPYIPTATGGPDSSPKDNDDDDDDDDDKAAQSDTVRVDDLTGIAKEHESVEGGAKLESEELTFVSEMLGEDRDIEMKEEEDEGMAEDDDDDNEDVTVEVVEEGVKATQDQRDLPQVNMNIVDDLGKEKQPVKTDSSQDTGRHDDANVIPEEEKDKKGVEIPGKEAIDDEQPAAGKTEASDLTGNEAEEEQPEVDKADAERETHTDSEQAGKEIRPDSVRQAGSEGKHHQPVDIDFKAGGVKDAGAGDIQLESSQPDSLQQSNTQAASMQSTPSLSQRVQAMTDTLAQASTYSQAMDEGDEEEETLTTEIGGTRFYIVDGEIADIVPDSAVRKEPGETANVAEPVLSQPPSQAETTANIQPTATDALPEMSVVVQQAAPKIQEIPPAANASDDTLAPASLSEPPPNAHYHPHLHDDDSIPAEHYQTSADFLNRKMLSVNNQVPAPPKATQPPGEFVFVFFFVVFFFLLFCRFFSQSQYNLTSPPEDVLVSVGVKQIFTRLFFSTTSMCMFMTCAFCFYLF